MATHPIITEVTAVQLAALVAAGTLEEGCQYKDTTNGVLYLATGVNTYTRATTDDGVVLPTPGAPFTLHTTRTLFGATQDDVGNFAYNVKPGTTDRYDANEPTMIISMEANYEVGGNNYCEFNTDYSSPDAVGRRPFSVLINRANDAMLTTIAGDRIEFFDNDRGVKTIIIDGSGNIGITIESPTAKLHLPASTIAANTAPLKIEAGTLMTNPENGAIEFDGTHLYITIGGVRKQLDN